MRRILLIFIFCTSLLADKKPNILFILADDLGYGDLSCYNDEAKVKTANLDQLANEGMRFTDAHSPSTVCTPSRYSIMTGRMAFRLNFKGVFTGVSGPCLITKDRLTLPQMLRNNGYETAMFGKWHIGMSFLDKNGDVIEVSEPPRKTPKLKKQEIALEAIKRVDYSKPIPDGPLNQGFDHFFGTVCCPTSDWLYAYIDGDRIPVPPTKIVDKALLPKHFWSFDCRAGLLAPNFKHENVDMVFLEKSLSFLDSHHKKQSAKPFFLFHSLQAVHLPSFPAKEFQGKTQAGPHGDFIYQFDYIVGKLVEKLKTLGMAENTLVIISSDNGPEVGTTINMRERYKHNGARPWRGVKRDNWEGGHRVPMIAWWPGKIRSSSVSQQTVCLTDIMATCASIVNTSLPNNAAEDSFNILPILLGQTTKAIREFTLHQTISLDLSIRHGDWKYLDHSGSGGNNYSGGRIKKALGLTNSKINAPAQLYNLKADPKEVNNLYYQHPEIAQQLKAKLEEFKTSGRSAPKRN
ncbi:arylsulphatase A [Lentisphaera araneosa HTCC2155]|uniref:Arylsulphatase A n=1 Tax=Lentisphaera araneosa HTCC2155 TaxID=313628 RepID=A6DF77_9BACT|nr:sulfatase-like hydrolase/transferase [Lentisphaera araneosa]EDM29457.1 arylsulphatase A [Lentisphaera araneosa HTCC2155]